MTNPYFVDDTHCVKIGSLPPPNLIFSDASRAYLTIKTDGSILIDDKPAESDSQIADALRAWAKKYMGAQ